MTVHECEIHGVDAAWWKAVNDAITQGRQPLWPATKLHLQAQDTSLPGWSALLQFVEDSANDARDTFSPKQGLGAELWSQVITLPPSIAKLKHVKKLDLYGSSLLRIPPEIGAMESLEEFDPYTSYGLHWFPYEITRCRHLRSSTVSTRALYGNYKCRPPFPSLEPVVAALVPARCSVCDGPIDPRHMQQVWVSLSVATDVLPLLVNACSWACVRKLPQPPEGYVQVPHKGGISVQQPLPSSVPPLAAAHAEQLELRVRPDRKPRPIKAFDDYWRVVEELRRRLTGDPGLAELASEIEQVLRFELERSIPREAGFSARLLASRHPAARRTALISDIHGNHAGLLAALADIESQNCDRIVCLGDLVEGGPENEEVVETLRRLNILIVRGNHDENNDVALSDSTRGFLMNLPDRMVEDDVLYVHISPRAIKRKINHEVEAWNVFDETSYRLIFIGHVHIPYIFGSRSVMYGEATRHAFEYNQPFCLSSEDSYIVSVGSIGYGRDKVGKIRYAIYDREARTVELRAIDGPVLPLDHAFAEGPVLPLEFV